MEFELLAQRVAAITGLNIIQATRLTTMNLWLISGENVIIAAIDPHIARSLAERIMEICRASVGDNLGAVVK